MWADQSIADLSTPDRLVMNQHRAVGGAAEFHPDFSVAFFYIRSEIWCILEVYSKIGHVAFICQRFVLLSLLHFFHAPEQCVVCKRQREFERVFVCTCVHVCALV